MLLSSPVRAFVSLCPVQVRCRASITPSFTLQHRIYVSCVQHSDISPIALKTRRGQCCSTSPRSDDASPLARPSLRTIAITIDQSIYELCIENQGRPAAAALIDCVRAINQAFEARLSLDRLNLQLELQPSDWSAAGPSRGLTASDKHYRRQWLDTVYVTLQLLALRERGAAALPDVLPLRPWREEGEEGGGRGEDAWLVSLVRRVLDGQDSGEEQSLVHFDRALATCGASGGVAAERRVIAPQFMPLSQLVLILEQFVHEQERCYCQIGCVRTVDAHRVHDPIQRVGCMVDLLAQGCKDLAAGLRSGLLQDVASGAAQAAVVKEGPAGQGSPCIE